MSAGQRRYGICRVLRPGKTDCASVTRTGNSQRKLTFFQTFNRPLWSLEALDVKPWRPKKMPIKMKKTLVKAQPRADAETLAKFKLLMCNAFPELQSTTTYASNTRDEAFGTQQLLNKTPDRLITTKEAAALMGVSESTLHNDRYIARKSQTPPKFPYVKLPSGGLRYRLSDLHSLINACMVK